MTGLTAQRLLHVKRAANLREILGANYDYSRWQPNAVVTLGNVQWDPQYRNVAFRRRSFGVFALERASFEEGQEDRRHSPR